jgi:predicted nucleic-acid-binding Zn-ribbon protein
MKDLVCPKCGSKDVLEKLPIADNAYAGNIFELAIAIRKDKPSIAERLFNDVPFMAKIKAWICVACGYTELYATNTKELKLAVIGKRNRALKKKNK